MHILLITQDSPFNPDEIVTGNAIRAAQLSSGLQNAGHKITHVWHGQKTDKSGLETFSTPDELRDRIYRHSPDVLLVGYWEILEQLPFDLKMPVFLDFIAPRPLETLYEAPADLHRVLLRLRSALAMADWFIVGSERQRHLLIPWLLQTGFDLRGVDPVIRVPISAWETLPRDPKPGAGQPLTIVSGGVSWPWRDSHRYWEAFSNWNSNKAFSLQRFGGAYKYHVNPDGNPPEADAHTDDPVNQPMVPYREFSDYLWQRGHIGTELAEENIERYFSQSFRSLEFLRHGLPLIANRYLAIAPAIEACRAGWLIDTPDEFIACLDGIRKQPEILEEYSSNALKLVGEQLHIDSTITPLLEALEKPGKNAHLRIQPIGEPEFKQEVPELAKLPFKPRFKHQKALLVQWLFAGTRRKNPGQNIVIITRDDLFPTDHGAAVKIVETARGLSLTGRKVIVVTDNRKRYWLVEKGEFNARKYPFWLRCFALPRILIEMLHRSRDIPASNSFLYLPMSDLSFVWRTLYAGLRFGAGIFQAEFPAYVRPAMWGRTALGGKVILVEHNVEYDRIRAQVRELSNSQYENLKSIEITLCNNCHAVICVSDNDRSKLIGDGVHPYLLQTIPHGVDLQEFASSEVVDVRTKYKIPNQAALLVYHGTYDYPPNLEAIQAFASELLPRLTSRGITAHLLAVGRNPPDLEIDPAIHFTGSVSSVAAYLKAADIAIVPLLQGGGTRMKILDYFAARLPVVSTSKGIEGIPVTNGNEALIEDDWEKMADLLESLLSNPEKARRLADNGYRWVQKLDWKQLAWDYLKIFADSEALHNP